MQRFSGDFGILVCRPRVDSLQLFLGNTLPKAVMINVIVFPVDSSSLPIMKYPMFIQYTIIDLLQSRSRHEIST